MLLQGAGYCQRSCLSQRAQAPPPKVLVLPQFPIVAETNIRKGFLSDEQYDSLRDELPAELKALFVTGYITGCAGGRSPPSSGRRSISRPALITLDKGETKNDEPRSVPILDGDMRDLLLAAKKERDEQWPHSPWVFSRRADASSIFGGRGTRPASGQGSRT